MEKLAAIEVLARIEAVRSVHPEGIVAFDGDGTLWSGDVGDDFFHALVARADFREIATRAMRVEAAEHGVPADGDGAILAQRIFDAHAAGRFPEERTYEMVTWACAGWSKGEMDRFAAEVIAGASLRARLHPEAVRALEWARGVGIEVFVVSASPRAIVEQAARSVGIDAAHVVASTPVFDGTIVQAEVESPIPYGVGKVVCLRAAIGDRPIHAAFGDNAFDVAMLAEARVPVAVRPKPRLRERAAEVPGLVEIAPEM